MKTAVSMLDVVALATDLPDLNLVRGQVGTVVEDFADGRFEVEFSDEKGRTYALAPISGESLIVLHYEPVAA